MLIKKLNYEVFRLKKIRANENLTDKDLKKIIESISLNDVLFIKNFEKFFPDFFQKLNNLASDTILLSELKLCALLKLGFSTKQIAVYTNSSIKAIEGRKYRIRKKLNLSKDDDSLKWFSNI
ncbi:helix-turn-helix transcriptional regulator [Chryseobacterium sp. SIMBA_038]|uniref:helix-turn-helix transcriptional regulator n=1 Tax=Chryseobacterium sp. SIMBA_038 TaxID=3085780 RepID=UPI0039788E21